MRFVRAGTEISSGVGGGALTHLKFVNCKLFHLKQEDDFQGVIDRIWNLPRLSHLYWEVRFSGTNYFSIPTVVSTSLQYLTILDSYWSSNDFPKLLEKTPHLRKFSVSLDSYEDDDIVPFQEFFPSFKNLSVTKLCLFRASSQRVMTNLFQLLPNITHLKAQLDSLKFNGYQWEEIIDKYLPQLKVFQLLMHFVLHPGITDRENENRVIQHLVTYRTPFWLKDRRWFIRCHWLLWYGRISICLYSLPYVFGDFPILSNQSNAKTMSTCPADMYFSYDSVRSVAYKPVLFDEEALSRVQLGHVEVLTLQLPIDHRCFSIVTSFHNLYALNVTIPTRNYPTRLQTLLNHAPRLYSFGFEAWSTSTVPPYNYTNPSIRRLDVHGYDQSIRRPLAYTTEQCRELTRSPLAAQCRVLVIQVEEVESILVLINSMKNLRTVEIWYTHGIYDKKYLLLDSLRSCLFSTWHVADFYYGHIVIRS